MKTSAFYSIVIPMFIFVFASNTNVCGQQNLVKAIREGDIEKANKIVDKCSAEYSAPKCTTNSGDRIKR
jgi:hypothetical protein